MSKRWKVRKKNAAKREWEQKMLDRAAAAMNEKFKQLIVHITKENEV